VTNNKCGTEYYYYYNGLRSSYSERASIMMSVIGPVQSHYHERSPVWERSLRCEGFVEKIGFEAWGERVKEWSMMRAGMMREMG